MNCTETLEHLSAFHDGELAQDLRDAVAEHLAACLDCSRRLAETRELSRLASERTTPAPPEDMWRRIESRLAAQAERPQTLLQRAAHRKLTWTAAAALLLVGISAALFAWRSNRGEHEPVAVHFGHYLDEFERNPDEAQQVLLTNYDGQPVTLDAAAERLQYRPAAPTSLPNGLSLERVYLLRMPCCTCVQAIYTGADDERLTIFEHVDDQPVWFGDRPMIRTHCHGVPTSLVQVNDRLAATWQRQGRHVTVVGPRDVKQVAELVDLLRPRNTRLN